MIGQLEIDHARYQRRVREMSTAQLLFIIKDAREAIAAMPDGYKAGYYADEICYCASELKRRRDAVRSLVGVHKAAAERRREAKEEDDSALYPHDEEDGISSDHLDLGAFESREATRKG